MTGARANEVTLHHKYLQVTLRQGVEPVSPGQVEVNNLSWISTYEKENSQVKQPCSRLDEQTSSTMLTGTSL